MEATQHQGLTRRRALIGAGAVSLVSASPVPAADDQAQTASQPFGLKGRFVQSGWCVGKGAPSTALIVDGETRGQTSPEGWFYVGFDRDAPATSTIKVGAETASLRIGKTAFDIQRVNGLPQQTVTPTDPAIIARTQREAALKAEAFRSRIDADWFKGGFIFPLSTFRTSGTFGNQRVLNGTPKSPHYGYDMAAPTGTRVRAPQGARVVLANPDMFYEGGLVFLDHGQGLISMYLHMSKVLVAVGDTVVQGQAIGAVGALGRATGPHLCWRLKWSGRYMDPSLMVI